MQIGNHAGGPSVFPEVYFVNPDSRPGRAPKVPQPWLWMFQDQLGLDEAYTDMEAEGLRFTLQGALNLQGGSQGAHIGAHRGSQKPTLLMRHHRP